ncbi:hypothetical protein SynA1528_02113 [Synechococcus sp. A15-28]|nr:hypothetical protein SynA1528_02113 [Synechococcus sp. A15-28]
MLSFEVMMVISMGTPARLLPLHCHGLWPNFFDSPSQHLHRGYLQHLHWHLNA